MKKTLFTAMIIIALSLIGCSKISDEQAIKDSITSNTDAMNSENSDLYMSTVYDDGSGLYNQTKEIINELFKNYDLESTISSIEIVEMQKENAIARVKAKTIKKAGGEFNNNEAVLLHKMIKHNGIWKISNTVIEDIEYTD